jgi:alpha/beta superfamily hydrolase
MKAELFTVEVMIPGIDGNLEGRLLYSREEEAEAGMIICPPHPLLAGNMDNNVVQAVAQRMAASMPVLLFNYPAVGKSFKPRPELPLFEYWNELDQGNDYGMITEEVKKIMQWSVGYFRRFHLVGYSFGAHMALTAMTTSSLQPLSYSAIAPPLAEYDFAGMHTLSMPGHVIRAEHDGLLAAPTELPTQKHITHTTISGTDHFFLKCENKVAALIAEFILSLE